MTETVMFRSTAGDKAQLRLEAQKRGIDVSQLIRAVLIKENLLSPSGIFESEISNF